MFTTKERNTYIFVQKVPETLCYHCGVACVTDNIAIEDKVFCCEGCKLVYEIVAENGLCDYYKIQSHPGLSRIKSLRKEKYAYLDNEEIAKQIYKFTDGDRTIVTLYLPGVHCSSCMWLLEHLHKINPYITESRLNFTTKEITVHFTKTNISLREIVELLATLGYEPYISLDDAGKKTVKGFDKQKIYKLGIAGFCFGNIMMMSFPEYLSDNSGIGIKYENLFRYLNLVLALPVFFYCGSEFFSAAWKGLKQKTLNIDAPIALAVIITFLRSIYEIASGTGSGYLDSMSGIIFFMLVGRVVQERTYKFISFNRDYKSYFPIAVSVVTPNGVENKMLSDLREKDVVQLHNDEIIPADSIVVQGNATIDYSFVTGESEPVRVLQGQQVYAGGRQTGGQLTIQIIKPVAGSYLTSLWNHYSFTRNKAETNDRNSIVHLMSRYFTYVLLTLALITAVYWGFHDPSKIMTSVTAMLIVACPCALLLSVTFTNGTLLRLLSINGLFLRDTTVLEQIGNIDHIVFDKTGTLTQGSESNVVCTGHQLTESEKDILYSAVSPSKHPYSKALAKWMGQRELVAVTDWRETTGQGVECLCGGEQVYVGSAAFTGVKNDSQVDDKTSVFVRIGNQVSRFSFSPVFRSEIPEVISKLGHRSRLSVLSGDNDSQRSVLAGLFGSGSELRFGQKPIDKLTYIESLQKKGDKVMMIGDGLNDAGALQQSNVGITLADDINNFTPSCDAILDSGKLKSFPDLLKLASSGGNIIAASFIISLVYNIIGLYFAMQGLLQPIYAAILMPCSTLSIVLVTSGMANISALRKKLSVVSEGD